ncbi:MAG TPA: hypothetical protein VGX49_07520 [Jatrophihabitans sp.]|jgi:hypothetical protein|nr:hypothetical protein [Jatrophihabitans sp.]
MSPTATSEEKAELLRRLTTVVDDFFNQPHNRLHAVAAPAELGGYTVVSADRIEGGFDHRWPDRKVAAEYRPTVDVPTARYVVRTDVGDYSLLIGAEKGGRATHGLKNRGRIVVFVQRGAGNVGLYPLVEFAETDVVDAEGRRLYAARVVRPADARKAATAEHLPELRQVPHLRDADIRRGDEIYANMQNGPALYIVVSVNDVEAMLVHAVWVGRARGGGRLPRPA